MCGIAGFYGKGNETVIKSMTDSLYYRGPDDQGYFVDENIALGHRRLSIIDLTKAGHQPMINEKKSVFLIFNGEIYNFLELRQELEKKYAFKSNTDSEVILHLYEEIGEEVFSRLNGMFAIALYDRRKKCLYLARDRMGKKPLYWCIMNNTFVFASELKALLKHPLFNKQLDLISLNKYLLYEYVPTPNSIFQNVYKLEPGHYLKYNGEKIKKIKFYDLQFKIEDKQYNLEDAINQLNNKINQATKLRLVSDVPLGIFLSGGIDSSLIAYFAQKNSSKKIKTFSIGFKESSFDESNYARGVANYLNTDHYEKILSAQDSLDLIPKIAELLDEPLADASILPTFLLSEFTREHVTVALGGDGGDELFCGYDTFVAHRLAHYYKIIPKLIRKILIEKTAQFLPTSFNNLSVDFKIKKFISGFDNNILHRNQIWLGAFNKDERKKLFTQEIWQEFNKENEFINIDNYIKSININDVHNQLIFIYLKTYLMDDILVKVDRASMYNSLEVRAPLLDFNVVDYVNSLPIELKLKGLKTKYIFKKLAEGKIPPAIINRKKKGFGIPLSDWLTKELKPLALELFDKNKIKKQGLFNYDYINNLLNNHFTRKQDNRKQIWTLMVFQLWYNKWNKN